MADLDGFTEFVAARQAALLRLAMGLTGDRQLAEDLAQTAFVRLWPHWRKLATSGDPWAYLQRILATTYATWWRRKWRGEQATETVPDLVPTADEIATADDRDAVTRWLQLLPERQRTVIVLRFLADLSVSEVADVLRCSEGTVRSQSHKALQHLRNAGAVASSTREETA